MTRRVMVIGWLAERFAECPAWPVADLVRLAEREGISLDQWKEVPEYHAMGIRAERRDEPEGCIQWWWTVEPKTEEEATCD